MWCLVAGVVLSGAMLIEILNRISWASAQTSTFCDVTQRKEQTCFILKERKHIGYILYELDFKVSDYLYQNRCIFRWVVCYEFNSSEIYMCVYARVCRWLCMCMYICKCIRACMCMCTYVHTCMHPVMYLCMHVHISDLCCLDPAW